MTIEEEVQQLERLWRYQPIPQPERKPSNVGAIALSLLVAGAYLYGVGYLLLKTWEWL